MRNVLIAGLAAAALLAAAAPAEGQVSVSGLRCEYRVNPLGIDEQRPRLSWVLESDERGQKQTAYRVLVAASRQKLEQNRGDLWDSGRVESDRSVHVLYGGRTPGPRSRCWWKVRVWDRHGRPSAWSKPAWWETALLERDHWQGARWITDGRSNPHEPQGFYRDDPAPLFRKEFELRGPVRRARLYVSGLGYYRATVNGQRAGDAVLTPGWTTYSERVLYNTYDVTDRLRSGRNCLSVMLGDGWYNPVPMTMWGRLNLREHLAVGRPRLIAQLFVEYADGGRRFVVTDRSWQVAPGPVVRNDVYLGELYDARRERPGWDTPGGGAGDWRNAEPAEGSLGPLRAQACPPVKVTGTLRPKKITEPEQGVYIFDFGRNFAGWARLRVRGPAGTRVRLRYGELLRPDGTLNPMTSVAGQVKREGVGGPGAPEVAWQSDTYVLKGDGEETYTPRFTFHGFRYVEATGLPEEPTKDTLTGLRLCSAVPSAGSFSCSNELLNRVQEMVRWTFRSNMFTVQSDCPHREKFQYGGDIVASADAFLLNLDMSQFYAKTARDFADAVRLDGGVTETAPYVGIAAGGLGGGSGPIGWGTAYPMVQWKLYQYYGNRRMLRRHYRRTRRWVEFVGRRVEGNVVTRGISDHESLDPKPTRVTGTAFYHQNVRTLSRIARVLGRDEDAAGYAARAEEIRKTFNDTFLDPDTGRYGRGTQACQAVALHHGLVPEGREESALEALVAEVQEHDYHLRTGIFGTRYLLLSLSERGRTDLAFAVADQRTFPGWGHMLERGATTLWEHWAFSDNTFSHNHPMFGSVSEWFYRYLAGIRPHPDAAGFDRFVIDPRPVEGLTWAKATYRSVRGKVSSGWEKLPDGRFRLEVSVPVNATAEIRVPAAAPGAVTEGGRRADRAPGLRLVGMRRGRAVFRAGSGDYTFLSHPPGE